MISQTVKTVVNVLSFPVASNPFHEQIDLIIDWSKHRLSKVVCVANVHMLMEGHWNSKFSEVLFNADLITPDGMPLVWMMNLLQGKCHDRVAGVDIMLTVCERARDEGIPVFFLGTDADTISRIRSRLKQDFPTLSVAGMEPLPFRPLTADEDKRLIERVNSSQAGVLFLALGCPKQEIWMHRHKDKINAVMIGVGGVFPVYAGFKKLAPDFVRNFGLEWLYRLLQEPKRLWRRYFVTIPPFVYLSIRQLLQNKLLAIWSK